MNTDILHVCGIHKSFGEKKVLSDVSLRVAAGEALGFLGPNGAGKTTLIRIVLGLVRPGDGSVVINGHDLKRDFRRAIAQVGAVVETPKFFPNLSAFQNLNLIRNLHPDITKQKIGELLELVGLSDRQKERVGTFSLGMKQRLGLARALINQPNILFLDEPMNGLDPQGMADMRELIATLRREKGIAFFITSHLLHEIEQACDKVVIIRDGRILAEGMLGQLLSRNSEVVDVYTDQIAAAEKVLDGIGFIRKSEAHAEYVTVELEKGCTSRLNELLVSRGFGVRYLVPRKATLEEVFMGLTGGGDTDDRTD